MSGLECIYINRGVHKHHSLRVSSLELVRIRGGGEGVRDGM